MLLGEVIFGGVGAGLYGMLVFVIIIVFLAGLMVGRTPEWVTPRTPNKPNQKSMIGPNHFSNRPSPFRLNGEETGENAHR